MSAHSPIDSLRRLFPVSDADAAAVFGEAGRDELLAGIVRVRPGRSVRRRRLVLAVAVLALAVIATAATWVALRAPARETTSVDCTSLTGNSDAIIESVSGDPAHDCAAAWQSAFGSPPPPLAAYDNGLGGVTVIPRSQTPPAGWTPIQSQDVALIELQESLDDYIAGLNSGCYDGAAATQLADAKLAQFGFTGWTVTVRDPSLAATPGNCVSGEAIEPASKTVTLIPFGAYEPSTRLQKLADKLRPLTQSCETLPAAVAAIRAAGSSLGLSPAPPETSGTYDLDAISDDSLNCALLYLGVAGTSDVIVRGPSG